MSEPRVTTEKGAYVDLKDLLADHKQIKAVRGFQEIEPPEGEDISASPIALGFMHQLEFASNGTVSIARADIAAFVLQEAVKYVLEQTSEKEKSDAGS